MPRLRITRMASTMNAGMMKHRSRMNTEYVVSTHSIHSRSASNRHPRDARGPLGDPWLVGRAMLAMDTWRRQGRMVHTARR